MPLENPFVFYSKYVGHQIRTMVGVAWTYGRLKRFAAQVWRDPDRYAYRDVAISPVGQEVEPLAILAETRGGQSIVDRRRRKALYATIQVPPGGAPVAIPPRAGVVPRSASSSA